MDIPAPAELIWPHHPAPLRASPKVSSTVVDSKSSIPTSNRCGHWRWDVHTDKDQTDQSIFYIYVYKYHNVLRTCLAFLSMNRPNILIKKKNFELKKKLTCVRLPFSIKKRVLGGIVSSLSGLVYNSSVLPLAFFEKNKKCHISHCLTPCVFWKKKKRFYIVIVWVTDGVTVVMCKIYMCVYIYIYIYLSHTRLFSCVVSYSTTLISPL